MDFREPRPKLVRSAIVVQADTGKEIDDLIAQQKADDFVIRLSNNQTLKYNKVIFEEAYAYRHPKTGQIIANIKTINLQADSFTLVQ